MKFDSHGVELFKLGVKPALLIFDFETDELEELKEKYEYIELEGFKSFFLFFQHVEQKDEFFANGFDENGRYKRDYMGLLLGYPPSAVERYISSQGIPYRIGINYNGISFDTDIDCIPEELEWLKGKYPIPEGYEQKVEFIHSLGSIRLKEDKLEEQIHAIKEKIDEGPYATGVVSWFLMADSFFD